MRNAVIFMIAHGLSAIGNADMIIAFEKESIIGNGIHEGIILKKGTVLKIRIIKIGYVLNFLFAFFKNF